MWHFWHKQHSEAPHHSIPGEGPDMLTVEKKNLSVSPGFYTIDLQLREVNEKSCGTIFNMEVAVETDKL